MFIVISKQIESSAYHYNRRQVYCAQWVNIIYVRILNSTNQYGASNERRQQDANQFRYKAAINVTGSNTVTHQSMQRVIFRHVPPSRTVDNRSNFTEFRKARDHQSNIAVHWLPLMLHKEEVIGPAITDEFLYGLSQFLLARDGKNKGRQKFNTGTATFGITNSPKAFYRHFNFSRAVKRQYNRQSCLFS